MNGSSVGVPDLHPSLITGDVGGLKKPNTIGPATPMAPLWICARVTCWDVSYFRSQQTEVLLALMVIRAVALNLVSRMGGVSFAALSFAVKPCSPLAFSPPPPPAATSLTRPNASTGTAKNASHSFRFISTFPQSQRCRRTAACDRRKPEEKC